MQYSSLKNTFSSSSHSDIAKAYLVACKWFEQFGFNLAVTRLRRYSAVVDELAAHYECGTLKSATFEHSLSQQANAYGEISEILRIHQGLASLYESELRDRLRKVLSGKEGRPSPSDFDPARDTAFELLVASRLLAAGYTIDFSNDADLVLNVSDTTLFVECKRLKSLNKLQKRIGKGLKQLNIRYANSTDPDTSRGLLALSISDMINPTHDLLVSPTAQSMGDFASNINQRFIEEHEHIWHGLADKRTIGVLVEFSTVGIIKEPHMLTTCTELGVNNCCYLDSPEWTLLSKLSHDMAKVGI
ncbi:MAG TPA: hypothetical protein PKE26_15925 [Kiritimatiellia bacterium]|mgnify:CR=1 FL=1|nr:hypothetical protein [Kiritimatiellia bacterium]HMP00585.1 hypothetical protein [Kiritimatiellia bacterium]